MRARYRSICVKFREDNAEQMHAWEYLRTHAKGTSYSALIANAVSALEKKRVQAVTEESISSGMQCAADGDSRKQMERMEQMLREIKTICTAIRDDAGRSLPPMNGKAEDTSVTGKREEGERDDPFRKNVISLAMRMGGEV